MQRIQKTIAEFITDAAVAAVPSSASVARAVQKMREQQADSILVVDDGALVGIFTERDFLNRVAGQRRDPQDTVVAEVMTRDPETLRPRDCISYVINRMAMRGFRNVPIVDEHGSPVAVLDIREVMNHLSQVFTDVEGPEGRLPASDEWVDIGGGG